MTFYNFPDEVRSPITGEQVLPTRVELPDWYRVSVGNVRRFTVLVSVDRIARVGDFRTDDLMTSQYFGEPLFDRPSALFDHFKNEIPFDEPDVVEWMLYATANNAWNLARASEYERSGSLFIAKSDDPYIPGLRIEDIYFRSETGTTVAERGYAVVVTPNGNIDVPVPGKKTIITPNLLGWASVSVAYYYQWVGTLIKFKDLTKNPESRIGFPISFGVDGKSYMVGPLFIVHEPSRRAFRNVVQMSITSDKPQTVTLTFRDVNDYTISYATLRLNVQSGQNEVQFKIRSLFGVPPMVVEIQPEDNTTTVLDYYKVFP